MGAVYCFVCSFDIGVNMIQYVAPPCPEAHMLVEVGRNLLHFCLVKVPSDNEYSIRVKGPLIIYGAVEDA